ncbi:hypothetical protein WICMUC_001918 [Wickerhamomyces mucosus]|uniref:Exocyst complex component EXO84 n=1 Tax=Wickerhamomyces mucosus TaxID=1378264 RepID=A0A9P8PRJ8_9ASCO|nr:hypothetical protein WICMUC_001918 [Wickerhamomyces mucosus]
MVDFSLRKTKGFGNTNLNNNDADNHQERRTKKKDNPYANLQMSGNTTNAYLPSINSKDKAKMGKSMQRRMSVHQVDPPLQFSSTNAPSLPNIKLDQYQQPQPQSQLQQLNADESLQSDNGSLPPVQSQNDGSQSRIPYQSQQIRRAQSNGYAIKTQQRPLDLYDPNTLKLLGESSFNAERFVATRLNDATASEIEKFSSNLSNLNRKVNNDINNLSIETYEKLLQSSKELKSTDSEMKFLRNAINDLADLNLEMREVAEKKVQLELDQTSQVNKTNSISKQELKKQRDRSSIIVLEKMWANEMNSLFKHVEGAQKYITAIPGRHIIAESGRWYELNAATFKSLQPAHIFLLNDLILVATRRRKGQRKKSDDQSLIADQCWPLREIKLMELKKEPKDGKNLYAINITYNSLSYTYQTDRLDHYEKILQGYKNARDELRDITEAEDLRQKKLRDSVNLAISENNGNNNYSSPKKGHSRTHSNGTHASNRQSLNNKRNSHNILQDISTRIHSRSRSLDNSNTLKILKALDDQIDEIDILIFHKNFKTSIEKLCELETELSALVRLCNEEESLLLNVSQLKIGSRRDEILKELIAKLKFNENHQLSFSEIENAINDLVELSQIDIAKTLFLNNRTNYINGSIARVVEVRDNENKPKIVEHIVEISIVQFQNMKVAIELYRKLFGKEISSLSYLIDWVIMETKKHIDRLSKILNNVKLKKSKLESSIVVIHRQMIELKDFGLDVEYLMDDFFRSIDTE